MKADTRLRPGAAAAQQPTHRMLPVRTLAVTLLAVAGLPLGSCGHAQAPSGGETIVLIRHGEKPPNGLGQLDCMGLNRSLALPKVLIGRFGRPDAIFAPDPADQIRDNKPGRLDSPLYSYVRPLATIEPTAIELDLPVDTQIGYSDIAALETAVTARKYEHSTIFIAWEHYYAERFGKRMLRTYGLDPSVIPHWSNSDYETIYVFHIALPVAGQAHGTLTFSLEKEGLESSLSATCPGAAP